MKPMLAGKFDPDTIIFPLLASPKLDGVRGCVVNGRLLSRSGKLIPNFHVQETFSTPFLNGLDGELIVGSPTDKDCYRKTVSAVMSFGGKPEVSFYAFDLFTWPGGFYDRLIELSACLSTVGIIKLHQHRQVNSLSELYAYEEDVLSQGYEGLILRSPSAPYKHGRSTTKEGGMIKLKRFVDSEARIVGMEELMHNGNEAFENELGHTAHSSHQENLIPMGIMGALTVQDLNTGVIFNIGTGFSESERKEFWSAMPFYIGKLIKYKHFPIGTKDKPRHPVYLGLREEIDL